MGADTRQARGPWLAPGEAGKAKGLASAAAWPRLEGSTVAPGLSLVAHCEGAPRTIVTRSPPGASGTGRGAGGYCRHSGLGA